MNFQKIYENIINENQKNNLINEGIKSSRIKKLFNDVNDNIQDERQSNINMYLTNIISSNPFISAVDHDTVYKNINNLIKILIDKKVNTVEEFKNEFVNFINELDIHISDDKIDKFIEQNKYYIKKICYFATQNISVKSYDYMSAILKGIDAGNITDDSIAIFYKDSNQDFPEEFKDIVKGNIDDINKNVKIQYSFAICINDNVPIGIISYCDGKIEYVSSDSYRNAKDLLNNSDEVIMILDKNAQDALHKHYERLNNSQFVKQNDKQDRRENQDRYERKLSEIRNNDASIAMKETVNKWLSYVKNICIKAQATLNDDDIFSEKYNDLINLIKEYKKVVYENENNLEYEYERRKIKKYMDDGNIYLIRVQNMIENGDKNE